MRRAQLFSQDIIFAMILVIFLLSLWVMLRDRVLHLISTTGDRMEIDEATSNALSQLLESTGSPSNWDRLPTINETTVESIGLVSNRNSLDSEKVDKFVNLAAGQPNSSLSLAALWHLNEGSGTAIYDSSGNGNTGSFYNTPDWVGGKFGNGLQFIWASPYEAVVVDDSNSLDINGNLTIELWFKQPIVTNLEQGLLNKGNTASFTDSNYEAWLDDTKIYASVANGTAYQDIMSASTIQADTWYHVAFTADGTNLTLYVNGVRENSTSQTMTPKSNSNQLVIGAEAAGGMLLFFNGTIDEVAIYSRAKSAEEIATDSREEILADLGVRYSYLKKLLGLDRSGYRFNFTVSTLSGTNLYNVSYTPSATLGNASYAAVNTTAVIERFALLNGSMVKVTLGVWIE